MKTKQGKQPIEHGGPRLSDPARRNAAGGRGRLKCGHLLLGRTAFWIALFWVGCMCLVAHSFAAGYDFTTIDHPAIGYTTEVLGVDGTNTVGYYEDFDGNYHGFLANSSTNETLDFPATSSTTPSESTYAEGISGSNIVGYYYDYFGNQYGFLLSGTTYVTLDDTNGVDGTVAAAVSGSNIAGYYFDSSDNGNGFIYSGGAFVTLDDTNGVGGTFATGISGSTVVGYYYDASNNSNGFIYSSGTYTTLDDPDAVHGTYATGISGGTVVGYYYDINYDAEGFTYSISGGTYNNLSDPYGNETYPNAVSGNDIVGYYYDSNSGNTYGFEYAISGTTYGSYEFPLPGAAESTNIGGIDGSDIAGYFTDDFGATHGYIFNGATYTQLDVNTNGANAANGTYATGISGSNVVGYYYDGSYRQHGFLYNGTSYTTYDDPATDDYTALNGISGSEIVGSCYDNSARAYVGFTVALGGTTYTTLYNPLSYGTGGLSASYANGISGTSIVGYILTQNDQYLGYLYDGTKYTAISDPLATGTDDNGDYGTAAYGISGKEIFGLYVGSDSIDHGFVDDKGKFTTIDDPLATGGYTQAVGISGSSIFGNYYDSGSNTHGFRATPLSSTDVAKDTDVGSYTAVLFGGYTGANGYATVVIKKTGKVTVAGKLPDNQSFTAGGDLIKDGTTPEFTIDAVLNYPKTKYYKEKGLLLGTVTFATVTGSSRLSGTIPEVGTTSNFTGTLEWSYPQQSLNGNGPNVTTVSVLGSAYSNAGTPLPGPGTVILSDKGALSVSGTTPADPAGSIDSVSDDLAVTSAQNKLTLKVDKATGAYHGTFLYPGETKPTSISGIVFQDLDNTGSYLINGGGIFLGPNGLGSVEIISH